MSSALRARAPVRAAQSFSATAVKIPAASVSARGLHMTGAREASPALAHYDTLKADPSRRSDRTVSSRKFNTSRTMKTVNDSSTVDFAYMPEISFANPASTELQQIPLLPDNYNPKRSPEQVAAADGPEPAVRLPEISTTSLGSVVSAFTEADANKAADVIGLVETKVKGEAGMVKQVMSDMLDDLLGGSKKVQAA